MNESKDELKARLIKDYMTQFQSNEERLEELGRLLKGEKTEPVSSTKGASVSDKPEMPSAEDIHQNLLKSVTDSLKPPEVPELSPFSEKVSDNENKKKRIRMEGGEG